MFYTPNDVWAAAVARNTQVLKAVVAQLLGMLAAYGGMEARKLPRFLRTTILQVLRPAESALRRVIVVAARDVQLEVSASKARSTQQIPKTRSVKTRASRPTHMSFQLFDPRKRFGQPRVTYVSVAPRVSFIAPDAPFAPPFATASETQPLRNAEPVREISARHLCQRLKAIAAALEDVPHQAKRLVRLQARRENRKSLMAPLRPGKPPGHRSTPCHGVDHILAECHKFALGVLAEPRPANAKVPNTS
jgi:hypothetical protein